MNKTMQMNEWSGEFGKDYTDRNPHTPAEMDKLYEQQFGLTRTSLNHEFMGNMDRSMRILEVGANVGTQLKALQDMGFDNLYGIELQWYAVEEAKRNTKGINLIQGSAFDLPFKDGYFDLVYTSGVLIHISPEDIEKALKEIRRCAKQFIWGFEYHAATYTMIPYRGKKDLLWKTDFAAEYTKRYPEFKAIKETLVPYKGSENVDKMYLLGK